MTHRFRSPIQLARHLVGLTIAAFVVVVVVVVAGGGLAHAHVTAQLEVVADDGTATVTFTFDHGCDGLATASLRIELPDQASDVTAASEVEGWQFASSGTEFGWTGGPVADGDPASFTATMRVWGTEGDTIWFPTVQGCPPISEEAWIEIQEPGQPEPAYVAPSIVLPRTIEPPTDTTAEPTTTSTAPITTTSTFPNLAITEEGSPRNNVGLVVGGIAVGVIVVGAIVLYLRHRRPPPPI
jgi:periplasmic copper chaperone A